MNDCRPNWYKKYGDSLQHWTDGKADFRVLWKDNEGTERRYAIFATDSHDAILRCAMAHPMVADRIVDVHSFSVRDLMTLEQYTAKVDRLMETDHGYKPGVTNHFPLTVMHEYYAGSTPEEAADKIQYNIEDADEGT
jgi:hypothetical protein